MIRPEWIIPKPNAAGDSVVVDREYFGHDQMLLIERPDGSTITCCVGARPHLRTGDRASLSIDEAVVYPVGYRPGSPHSSVPGLSSGGSVVAVSGAIEV